MPDLLTKLAAVIEDRKSADPNASYVAALHAGGADTILRKIGEEATEVVLAAKNGQKTEIIHEIADLWFHTMILLSSRGLGPDDVLKELERRFGQSGLAEKAARK